MQISIPRIPYLHPYLNPCWKPYLNSDFCKENADFPIPPCLNSYFSLPPPGSLPGPLLPSPPPLALDMNPYLNLYVNH